MLADPAFHWMYVYSRQTSVVISCNDFHKWLCAQNGIYMLMLRPFMLHV